MTTKQSSIFKKTGKDIVRDFILNYLRRYDLEKHFKKSLEIKSTNYLTRDEIYESLEVLRDEDIERNKVFLLKIQDQIEGKLPDKSFNIKEIDPYPFKCSSKRDKNIFKYLYIVVSNMPFYGKFGSFPLLVKDKNTDTILGLLEYSVPILITDLRYKYINLKKFNEDKKDVNVFVSNSGKVMATCVSLYPFSEYLGGKLIASIGCSRELIRDSFGDNMYFVETTSLYGKSIQYDRLPFLRFGGLTVGTCKYLFRKDFLDSAKKLTERYYDFKYNRYGLFFRKSDLLNNLLKFSGLPYKITSVRTRRGYYYSILDNESKSKIHADKWKDKWYPPQTIDDAVRYWKERWLSKRIDRKVENFPNMYLINRKFIQKKIKL